MVGQIRTQIATPIFLIKVDTRVFSPSFDIWKFQDSIQERFRDYHVLAIPVITDSKLSEPIKVEVFYEKDFDTKERNYVLKFVKETLNKYEQNKDKEEEDRRKKHY